MRVPATKSFEYWYGIVALIVATAAFMSTSPVMQLLLGWIALSFLLVSSAYYYQNPGIFRKDTSGHLPFYISVLLWPFLLTTHLYNAIARKKDTVPPIQEVAPGIFVARRLLPADVILMKKLNISAVLDATAEFNALEWSLLDKDVDYMNVPTLDHQAPDMKKVIMGINWVNKHRNRDKNVLIHCALGRGRSVFMAAAWLLSEDKSRSVREVLEQINSKRQTAKLNSKQLRALDEIAQNPEFKLSPNAWLVANPVSGGGKWQTHKNNISEQLGLFYSLTVEETTEDRSATQIAENAMLADANLIIACGGDGTVKEVISVAAGTGTPVAIIPLGTTNALSHALWGIEAKISPVDVACEKIISGKKQKIDVGKCNDEIFGLVMGVGFESRMIELADRQRKNDLGQLAYLSGLLEAIKEDDTYSIQVQFDDEDWREMQVNSLVAANAAPMFTLLAQGDGEPDATDGHLDITILDSENPQQSHFATLFELLTASFDEPNHPAIIHKQCKSLRIKSQEIMTYVIDGELREATEIHVEILPGAINLMSDDKAEQ